METAADDQVDRAVKTFYDDRKSQAIAITASQGIGKTNLLNAYERELREVLGARGFFVIRYMADPDPSFDPLIRSIFECLHENDLLKQAIEAYAEVEDHAIPSHSVDSLSLVRTPEVRAVLKALLEARNESEEWFKKRLRLAEQWFLGLPVRKEHQTELGVQFRLDTVESKTRALRDVVSLGVATGKLEGIFLLLDELEKQGAALSKSATVQYLSALRALIDALPSHLFLMVALTLDALDRYQEMFPALRGRLRQVQLLPLQTEEEALKLMNFYLEHSREEARLGARKSWGNPGTAGLVTEDEGRQIFNNLFQPGKKAFHGVRQREYLDNLHNRANEIISDWINKNSA